jgi:hypothetical protein
MYLEKSFWLVGVEGGETEVNRARSGQRKE